MDPKTAKELISKRKQQIINTPKVIEVHGGFFPTLISVSEFYHLSIRNVIWRLNSPRYPEWTYH